MATITFYLLLVSIFQGKCIATKQFRTILALVSYSDSLRCYGGKGGGKFQECHQDDGYKTCFTKYENGNIITHEECVFMRNIPPPRRQSCAGLRDQEADAVCGVRGAQEQERAGGVLLLLV